MPVPEVALTEPCPVDDVVNASAKNRSVALFEKAHAEFALPETEVAEQACRFAEQIEPAFVFAHSVRSCLYARELAGRGRGSVTENRLDGQDRRAGREVRSRSSCSLRSPAERVWR